MKTCRGCGQEKPLTEFWKYARGKDGLNSRCRTCVSATNRAWYERNENIRKGNNLRRYDLTLDEFRAMEAAQNGACLGCEQPEWQTRLGTPRSLCVDHDHVTGRVRGLLCSNCNRVLGLVADAPAVLRRLADYLESHAQEVVA